MAAAAVTSPACPLRRSSRLTSRRLVETDPDDDHDDPENELTPRALRALKRQRLSIHIRPRPRRRRKENVPACAPPRLSHPPSQLATSAPLPNPTKDPPRDEHRPELALAFSPDPPSPLPAPEPEPLTPLTPLTPSPESSPSFPGHDRPTLPPSPPPDPDPHPSSADPFPPPPLSAPLDASLDALIPFDALPPHFPPDVAVQIPPPCQPPQPQLQPLELPDQFHSFPQQQLYVPPPLFVRDREINIWKLACQERVDCLLRRYGIDYIKALVKSEARSLPQDPSPTSPTTRFRLYTPASYTYSSSSWGPSSRPPKALPLDDEADEPEPGWPADDPEWADADVDMEDDDDDYEDDDDAAEGEPAREVDTTADATSQATPKAASIRVDPPPAKRDVDASGLAAETASTSEPPVPSHPDDTAPRPLTPPLYLPPPPLAPPMLPPLSSLHVPLLSEPPRAFMGRGTPPDRRRLIEWSGSGRFTANGLGPPLYLSSPPSADVDMVPMSVDTPGPPPSPQPSHPHGEWTSFLFSVLEGDGVGVGAGMASAPHASEPTWYELGLGAVPGSGLELPLAHPNPPMPTRVTAVEQPVEEGSSSSSTLRFALG